VGVRNQRTDMRIMGVFIGWSGKDTKSYLVAVALRGWLQQVVQGCDPWVSSQDIDAGDRWGSELFTQLDKHGIGIICVTKENQDGPWLNFEAGALVKQLKGDRLEETRVCPLLIDMTTNDVTGPLKLLQTVPLNEVGMFKVLQMVNKNGTSKALPDDVLKRAFDKWWPDLEGELKEMKLPEQQPERPSRTVPEMLDEILTLVRSIDKATNRISDPDPLKLFSSVPASSTLTSWPLTSTYLSPGQREMLEAARRLTDSERRLKEAQKKAQQARLKEELVREVRKTDTALAKALAAGDETYDGETLTITLKQVIRQKRLELIKEVADRMGLKLRLLWTSP
jgi:hypothetical protein